MVGSFSPSIEPMIDPISPSFEVSGLPFAPFLDSLGPLRMSVLSRSIGASFGLVLDPVGPVVESSFDPVSLFVETVFDAIAPFVETFFDAVSPLSKPVATGLLFVVRPGEARREGREGEDREGDRKSMEDSHDMRSFPGVRIRWAESSLAGPGPLLGVDSSNRSRTPGLRRIHTAERVRLSCARPTGR